MHKTEHVIYGEMACIGFCFLKYFQQLEPVKTNKMCQKQFRLPYKTNRVSQTLANQSHC